MEQLKLVSDFSWIDFDKLSDIEDVIQEVLSTEEAKALILALICTTWFLIGGIFDVIDLFKSLRSVNRNRADDGSVVDGQNAGESNDSSKSE